MKKYGFKISGCLGDIVNATPVFKYVSRCHNQKLLLETNLPSTGIHQVKPLVRLKIW